MKTLFQQILFASSVPLLLVEEAAHEHEEA
jgi:hypothetical protein